MKTLRYLLTCCLLSVLALAATPAQAQVNISVGIAPPPLIVEDQPLCPTDGYLWTPGYWAYDPGTGTYYWVPGTWCQPPEIGFLWTPCWWGWNNGFYNYHRGYWGRTCGFYGGVNYGHGYWGRGYDGGRWQGNHFFYNTAANNVNRSRFHNTYADRSVVRNNGSRTSFNGGRGGINAQATPQERQAEKGNRVFATSQQRTHEQTAIRDRSHQVKVNNPGTNGANRAATGNQRDTQFTGQKPGANNGATGSNKRDAAFTGGDRSTTGGNRNTTGPGNKRDTSFTGEKTVPKKEALPEKKVTPQRTEAKPPTRTIEKSAPARAPQHTSVAPRPQVSHAPVQHSAPASHPAPQMHSAPHPSGGGGHPAGGGGGHPSGGGGGGHPSGGGAPGGKK